MKQRGSSATRRVRKFLAVGIRGADLPLFPVRKVLSAGTRNLVDDEAGRRKAKKPRSPHRISDGPPENY